MVPSWNKFKSENTNDNNIIKVDLSQPPPKLEDNKEEVTKENVVEKQEEKIEEPKAEEPIVEEPKRKGGRDARK